MSRVWNSAEHKISMNDLRFLSIGSLQVTFLVNKVKVIAKSRLFELRSANIVFDKPLKENIQVTKVIFINSGLLSA
jgi:hypothetical protein